ncbi:hypothetical protein I6U33_07105 [Pseudomonas carnis]|uniref:hypothetical protein n=4 Tax=Pseudomonas TaxID=286 RepID=UPI0018E89CF9|nr:MULTISPECIES: hypothetical protein [Pseudomonas]MBJ2225191.1 hypothetical protein [Pseudomonas sp. MF7451]MBW9237093.1 hypothetical protein [Pseudomonas carnis]
MPKDKTLDPLLPPIVVPLMEPAIDGDIEGAHGGIGLRHTEVPLVVYLINPKDGVTPGSVASLFWGNRNIPVASTPIREGEQNLDLFPMTVPAHHIVPYLVDGVRGMLRRSSGNESFTEEIKLRVSLTRPGGEDKDSLPGHQGLAYEVPPEVLLHGVNQQQALAGVKIIIRYWLNMRAYDLITLAWGSQVVQHRVQPGEVGRDITLTVDYATISAAGNNRLTRVAYQVRDAGGNLPEERARWSAVSLIDVHLNEVRPEAPWLQFPDTGTKIDLAELGSWDVEVALWVLSQEASAYSHVTLIWAGLDSEGNSIPYTHTEELSRAGLYTFEVPNALVSAIAEGSASVHALYQNGAVQQPSEKLYLDVVGQVVRWPAPTIDEDQGGHIEPDVDATVRFPLQGSWPKDGYIEVIFRVSSADNTIEHRIGREVDDIPPTAGGDLLFTVYPDELRRFDGHLTDVFYAHTRPGGRPQESLRLQIVVGQIKRTMPKPIVDKAVSGQLNPDDVGAYATVFAPFGETLRGDWIRMYWLGRGARTEVPVQVAVNGATTTHDIEKYYVENNLDESVTVFYTLTRSDEAMPRYSEITEVLISRGVGELPSPTLREAQTTGPDTAELEPLRVQQGTQLVVSYVGMRNSDSIKVTMNGADNGGSPDIPAKPGNEALQEVAFDISRAAIAANIRDHATTVKYHYVVTRAGVSVTSAILTVTVRPIPQSELAKTVIRLNEANSATKVLDLDSFVGNAMAHVGTWPFITAPYPVSLKFFGRTAANVAHDLTLFSFNSSYVNPNWVAQGRYEYRLLRTYLDGLGHGKKLRMEFKAAVSLSKVEAEAISFPVVEYTVNTLPAEFPVPKLTQATGTGTSVTLAPLNAQNGGTVSVEYTPMYTTDSIKVTMVGTAGAGSPVIPAKNGVTAGKVTFDITKAAIAANVGNANKTLTLKYDVTRSGKVVASKVLTVTVTPIPTTELAKTVIRINEADAATKVLDLSGSVTNKTLRVGSWPFIASFQPVAMLLSGFKADGSVHELQVWTLASNAVTAGWFSNGFYDQRVAASYFLELGHDTKLKLQFKATLSSSQAEADAIIFPIVEYTVNTLPAEFPVPKLTQATGTGTSVTLAPLNAQNGGTVSVEYTPMYTTDSIKVTMVGTAGAGSPVIPAKNGVTAGKITFDITKAAIAANVGNADKTFTLKYDVTRSGKVVASKVLTVTVTPIPQAELAKTVLKINQANAATQVLDLTTFTGDATGQIGVWPFITAPYPVWLKLQGKTDKGDDHSLTVYNGAGSAAVNPTWIANGKNRTRDRSYLSGGVGTWHQAAGGVKSGVQCEQG